MNGGTVLTLNARNPVAQSITVADGRVLACGSDHDIAAFVGSSTRLTLHATTVLIGFPYPAAVKPASSAERIVVTSSAVKTSGGDRMMFGPDTRIIAPD